jgi:hypothetical protein
VAAILSVVKSCRRLKISVRDYLAAVRPDSQIAPIQRLIDLTPAGWIFGLCSGKNSTPSIVNIRYLNQAP